MCRRPCLPMPGCEGMPQIVPSEIKYPGTLQCIAPGLGVDLHDGIALVGEHMRRVIALGSAHRARLG